MCDSTAKSKHLLDDEDVIVALDHKFMCKSVKFCTHLNAHDSIITYLRVKVKENQFMSFLYYFLPPALPCPATAMWFLDTDFKN